MKKALIGAASLLFMAAAGIGGYSYYQEQQVDPMIQENLEALSFNENNNNGDSNNNGSGMYFYTHLQGRPKECTLYVHTNASGGVSYSESNVSANGEFSHISISGIKETCPDKGNGCTVYSCRQTP